MDFPERLRAAVSASDLSLQQVSALLSQAGTPVSISSLSAWQSGVSRPERPASLKALDELEAILGLPVGELRDRLPVRSSRGRASEARLPAKDMWDNPGAIARVLARLGAVPSDPTDPQPLSQRLHLVLDEHGHMRSLQITTLVRARRNNSTRIISVSQDEEIHDAPQVVTSRGAKVGRFRADPATGVSAYELLFPRPLAKGELALVDFTERFPPRVDAADLDIRIHPGARDVALSVEFHPSRRPAHCWAWYRPRTEADDQHLEELTGDIVQLVRIDPAPGIYGISWSW